jgi:nucleoid DNA-binding protein
MAKVVLSHRNFIEDLRLNNNLTGEEADQVMRTVYETIRKGLTTGHEVRLINIGTFKPRNYAAHPARNPATGEIMQVADQTVVSFKVSQILKDQVRDVKLKD